MGVIMQISADPTPMQGRVVGVEEGVVQDYLDYLDPGRIPQVSSAVTVEMVFNAFYPESVPSHLMEPPMEPITGEVVGVAREPKEPVPVWVVMVV